MKMTAVFTCVLLVLTMPRAASAEPGFSHAGWDSLLGEFVADGVVDYSGLLAERARLDAYLGRAAEERLAGWTEAERKAK